MSTKHWTFFQLQSHLVEQNLIQNQDSLGDKVNNEFCRGNMISSVDKTHYLQKVHFGNVNDGDDGSGGFHFVI